MSKSKASIKVARKKKPKQDPREVFKTGHKKAILITLLSLFGAGGVGGSLYAFKDQIFGTKQAATFKVTYNCGDGMLNGEHITTIDEDSNIKVAPNPTRENYVFGGWYKEETFKNKITFPHKVENNEIMFAKWNRIGALTVSFVTNSDECTVPELTVVKGKCLRDYGKLTSPHKADHEFKAWCYDEDLNNPINVDTAITDNLTLYAKYEKNAFTIKFDTCGGTKPAGTLDNGDGTYKMNSVQELKIEPYSEQLKPGSSSEYLAFTGWAKKGSRDLISYPLSVADDNTILEAKFIDTNTYTVSFYKDDNSKIPFKTINHVHHIITPPTEKDIPDADANYKLKGWYVKGDTEKKPIDFTGGEEGGGYKPNTNVALVGDWEQVKYNVDFYTVVDGKVSSERVDYAQCAYLDKAPDIAVEDCELIGWYDNKECKEGTRINFSDVYYLSANTNLYGKYERTAFGLKYVDEDGTTLSYNQHISSITKDSLPSISKTNHKPTYYINGVDVTQTINDSGIQLKNYKKIMDDNTLTVNVKWVKNAYTLTLHYPDGIHDDVKLDGQNEVTISDLHKYEYTGTRVEDEKKRCDGWSLTNGGDKITTSSITLDHDTDLYAKYVIKVFKLTIKCVDTSGKELEMSTDPSISIDYGTHYKKDLTVPTVKDTNFGFMKWQTASGEELSSSFNVTSDITLKAVFNKYYDVQFGYIKYEKMEDGFIKIGDPLTHQQKINTEVLTSLIPQDIINGRVATIWGISGKTGQSYEIFSGTRTITEDNIMTEGTYKGKCVIAVVLKISQFNVHFKNGETDVAVLSKTTDQIIRNSEVPDSSSLTPPSDGAVFNGWKDKDGKYVDFTSNTYSISSPDAVDIYFTAAWNNNSKVTFNVDSNYAEFEPVSGGDSTTSITVLSPKISEIKEGDTISSTTGNYKIKMKEITGHSYKLNGWYYDNTTFKKRANFPFTDESERTVYGKFVELSDECSVLFDAGTSSFEGTSDKQIILTSKFDTTLGNLIATDPNYKRPLDYGDYEFKGWSIYDGSKGTYTEVTNDYVFKGNVYLYPVFKEVIKTPVSFTQDNWPTLLSVAERGYEALKEAYKTDYESTSKTKKANTFAGLTRTMKIDNLDCQVMVVGEKHDTISGTNKKASLTFITTETPIKEVFNPSLYTGKSNQWATASVRDSMQKGLIKSKIDETVMNHIQTVEKHTRWGQDDSNVNSTTYLNADKTTNDTVFLLSATELGITDIKYNYNLDNINCSEGSKYSYLDGTASTIKFKYRSSSTKTVYTDYWTRSPYNHTHDWKSKNNWNGYLGSGINRIDATGVMAYTDWTSDTPIPETPTTDAAKAQAKKAYFADIYRAIIFGFAVGIDE